MYNQSLPQTPTTVGDLFSDHTEAANTVKKRTTDLSGDSMTAGDLLPDHTETANAVKKRTSGLSVDSMTALGRCLNGGSRCLNGFPGFLQTMLRVVLVGYSLCISGIFALFAIRRAEGNVPLSVLFGIASAFYNVFGALMFGKRVGGFLSESWKRAQQKDLIYLSFWLISFGLAGMTAMAGVKISEDSVSLLSHDALIKSAVGMFVFNTLSTRWAGGLDLLEKVYKEIRYNDFDRFFQDWKKYDGAALTNPFSSEGKYPQSALITHFYEKLASEKKSLTIRQELTFYSDKMLKMSLGIISLPLLPMWISLTANGLRAIDPVLEASAPFTITCAFSNLPFYFLSCFNLYPNVKALVSALAKKYRNHHDTVRNIALAVGFFAFLALAIVSGGGYGMEVKGMVEKGYGKTAHDVFPDGFFNATNPIASGFAMSIAGLVNFANTAKFFADVLKLQAKNPSLSLIGAMVRYMNPVKNPQPVPEVSDSTSSVSSGGSQCSMASIAQQPLMMPSSEIAGVNDMADHQQQQQYGTCHSSDEEEPNVSEVGDGVSEAALTTYTEEQTEQLVADMEAALSENEFHSEDRSALRIQGAAVTAGVIQAGRSKWHAATAWCCSWFSSAAKKTESVGILSATATTEEDYGTAHPH